VGGSAATLMSWDSYMIKLMLYPLYSVSAWLP
jgi:hypothetical protein